MNLPAQQENDALLALFNAGRDEETIALALDMTRQHPLHAFGWMVLGVALKQTGRSAEALAPMRRTVALLPDNAIAHANLGATLQDLGRHAEAEASLRRSLQLNPDNAQVHGNLGVTLQAQGLLEASRSSLMRALELDPHQPESHSNLGNTLKGLGFINEAEASYRRALVFNPKLADAHYNLGVTLQETGRLEEAEACYRRVLALEPGNATASNNLSATLKDQGRLEEAEACCRTALALKPDYADAHINLGAILFAMGRSDEAAASYRRALDIAPDNAMAHSNLGVALQDMGDLDEALASYRRALAIKPDFADARGNLLFALNYHPDMDADAIFRAYQEYDEKLGQPLRQFWRAHGNDRNPDRRLKVGYVSPDFRHHSGRYFLEPLLAHHDKTRFEIYAYAELAQEDYMSERYRACVEHWIPTKGMSDEAMAERIRSDGIDILVELAGHTAGNRLPVFARKPAPVSLSWLGYGYTTGLSAIDYHLTDEVAVPEGAEHYFSERPWRIATPSYVYRPAPGMGETGGLPAIRKGHVTFGSLTRSIRINHRTIRAWNRILKAVPGSRLVMDSLNCKTATMQENLALRFTEQGIARDRLEFGFHSPPWDVLRGIDIGLDCFPHNSGTTLFETLYMGIPYVTLAGRPSVGTLGSSILHGAGRPEWIANSEEEYVTKAVELANDMEKLAKIRAALRVQLQEGALQNEDAFALKVENAYREMWQIWCMKNPG